MATHVVNTRRHYKDKVYETTLLRRSYREDGKVKNETLANLSHLPAETIEVIRESLAGKHPCGGRRRLGDRTVPAPRPCRRGGGDGPQARCRPRCSVRPARSATSRWR